MAFYKKSSIWKDFVPCSFHIVCFGTMNHYGSEVATSNKFPGKLWRLVNSCRTGAIGWGQGGHTIIIHQAKFQRQFLDEPNCLFKTTNIGSFIRQLNLYGFRKLNALRYSSDCGNEIREVHEFQNDYFIRGRSELLASLRRNVGIRRSREMAVKRRLEALQTYAATKRPRDLQGTQSSQWPMYLQWEGTQCKYVVLPEATNQQHNPETHPPLAARHPGSYHHHHQQQPQPSISRILMTQPQRSSLLDTQPAEQQCDQVTYHAVNGELQDGGPQEYYLVQFAPGTEIGADVTLDENNCSRFTYQTPDILDAAELTSGSNVTYAKDALPPSVRPAAGNIPGVSMGSAMYGNSPTHGQTPEDIQGGAYYANVEVTSILPEQGQADGPALVQQCQSETELLQTVAAPPYHLEQTEVEAGVMWQAQPGTGSLEQSVCNLNIANVRSIAEDTPTFDLDADSQTSSVPASPILSVRRVKAGTLTKASCGMASPMSEVTSILRAAALSTEASAKMTPPSVDGDRSSTSMPPVLGFDAIVGEVEKSEMSMYIREDEVQEEAYGHYMEPFQSSENGGHDPQDVFLLNAGCVNDRACIAEAMPRHSQPELIDLSDSPSLPY